MTPRSADSSTRGSSDSNRIALTRRARSALGSGPGLRVLAHCGLSTARPALKSSDRAGRRRPALRTLAGGNLALIRGLAPVRDGSSVTDRRRALDRRGRAQALFRLTGGSCTNANAAFPEDCYLSIHLIHAPPKSGALATDAAAMATSDQVLPVFRRAARRLGRSPERIAAQRRPPPAEVNPAQRFDCLASVSRPPPPGLPPGQSRCRPTTLCRRQCEGVSAVVLPARASTPNLHRLWRVGPQATCRQASVSPPRSGLSRASPNGTASGSTQAWRARVTVPVLRGRP